MLMVTPPQVSLWPPWYCLIRACGFQPSLRMYGVLVLAIPSQRAIQIWSGRTNAVGRVTRASSSALMPDPALE
jgi:hypothetical protein